MNKPKQEWILHIDGDGFFAYCEIARFPHLHGKPVVVGEDRGIVCASTYEAKRLGITRGMPIFKVREQFPDVVILSSHFELYDHYAARLASLVEPSVDILERYSIDECFASISFATDTSRKALLEWLYALKTRVQTATGLTYSFGLARTKVLAKIASKRQKPDGCTVLTAEDEAQVLADTSIESLWGIGWKLSRRLLVMRVRTADDFVHWSHERVSSLFARPVQELWYELQGRKMFDVIDDRSSPKSIQSTKSFTATREVAFVTSELLQNIDIAFTRLRDDGLVTNAMSIFLKTKERDYHTASIVLPTYTANPLDAVDLVRDTVKRIKKKDALYRSTGVTLWNLRLPECVQKDLFGEQQATTEKNNLMQAVDSIREKYGQGSIGTLGALPSGLLRRQKTRERSKKEKYIHGLPLPYLGEVH